MSLYMTRRRFITSVPIAAASLIAFPVPGFSFNKKEKNNFTVVETGFGKLRGIRDRGVNIFLGIPYGGKVSGKRRFKRPEPVKPWAGIRDALVLGNPSIQPPNQTYGINEPDPDEECLYLNVWTPANDNKKRPVMFYNHGGGFSTGSGGSAYQDGANLARLYDVVVVESNHRLGLLGYLYLEELAGEEYAGSGNMGMLDIVAALEWVNKNISCFGGDPDNVMVFGESGGGAKTSCIYAMPEAAPFFNKASIESGPGIVMADSETAAETAELVLKTLNINKKDWQKLLDIPAADLLDVQKKLPEIASQTPSGKSKGIGRSGRGGFGPVVDGRALPANPFEPKAPDVSRDKPLMVGWNEDEAIFFAVFGGDLDALRLDSKGLERRIQARYGKEADLILNTYKRNMPGASPSDIYIAISSITSMGLGSVEIAEKKTAQKAAPAYLYNFGYKSEVKIPDTDYTFRTMHALDIPFKFNNVEPMKDGSAGMVGNRPERYRAGRNMSEMWATFARTGIPSAKGQPEWRAYNMDTRPTMRIDTECKVINNRFKEEIEMWKTVLG